MFNSIYLLSDREPCAGFNQKTWRLERLHGYNVLKMYDFISASCIFT